MRGVSLVEDFSGRRYRTKLLVSSLVDPRIGAIGLAITADDSFEDEVWIVSEANAGSGAKHPLAGTNLTATLDDGSVSGTSGCNSYFASYVVDGGSISVGPVGSTHAFCSEPTGVMNQESAYL